MLIHRWIPWVSIRFITGHSGGKGRILFLLPVLLIALGVTALNTVLAVMNGLQQGYIGSILEVGSYHLLWSSGQNLEQEEIGRLVDNISTKPGIRLATVFREGKTTLSIQNSVARVALIRGVQNNIYEKDRKFAQYITIVEGSFDLSDNGVVLGERLATNLRVSVGEKVLSTDIGNGGPLQMELTVTGLFRCPYKEYEDSLAFVSLVSSRELFPFISPRIGIKIMRLNRDAQAMLAIRSEFPDGGNNLESWKILNKSFFGALRTEKNMMFILLGIIFIVVAVNIDQSLQRMAIDRTEDIAIIKAVGASPVGVRFLFISQGFIIGASGALVGSILGVLVSRNIDRISFYFLKITGRVNNLWSLSMFRSAEIMTFDVVLIFLIATLMSTLAAFNSARIAADQKPSEVLRGE